MGHRKPVALALALAWGAAGTSYAQTSTDLDQIRQEIQTIKQDYEKRIQELENRLKQAEQAAQQAQASAQQAAEQAHVSAQQAAEQAQAAAQQAEKQTQAAAAARATRRWGCCSKCVQPRHLSDPSRRLSAIQAPIQPRAASPATSRRALSWRATKVSISTRQSCRSRPASISCSTARPPSPSRTVSRDGGGLRVHARAGPWLDSQGAALLLRHRVRELTAPARLGLRRPCPGAAVVPRIEPGCRRRSSELDRTAAGVPGAGRGDWQAVEFPFTDTSSKNGFSDRDAVRSDRW